MSRNRSTSKLESRGQQKNLSDEQLYKMILQASCEGSHDLEQLQLTIKDIMVDDPERIRVAYRKVAVEMKSRSGASSEPSPAEPLLKKPQTAPLLTVAFAEAGGTSRASQRRKLSRGNKAAKGMSVVLDASGVRDVGGLEKLRSEMAALCQVRHQNLLCLTSFSLIKGARFTLDFDLASASHVLLRDMFQEEVDGRCISLNGCEVACVLAQICLGMIFLVDCVTPVMKSLVFTPAACLTTQNIILTSRGLIKLCAHHQVIRMPSSRGSASVCNNPAVAAAAATTPIAAGGSSDGGSLTSSTGSLNEDPASATAADDQEQQQGQSGSSLAHMLAMLLYELDHDCHQVLASISRCAAAERRVLDERYGRLFSMCADWEADKPVDLRSVLYCSFISEQTSSISSFQSPLELVFDSRFQ